MAIMVTAPLPLGLEEELFRSAMPPSSLSAKVLVWSSPGLLTPIQAVVRSDFGDLTPIQLCHPHATLSGCTHTSFSVKEGMSYRFRLIASTSLLYTSICFENHEVSVIALDGLPVEPFSTECVDLNIGQRADVILDTKTSPMVAKNFWISVNAQERAGTPSGYAVLSYEGAAVNTFPETPTPSSAVPMWSMDFYNGIKIKKELTTLQPRSSPWAQYQKPYGFPMPLVPPQEANRVLRADISLPLFNATGIFR
eukprot:gene18224-24675_t